MDPRLQRTQFVFRQLFEDSRESADGELVRELWGQFGDSRDDCALALLELQSSLDFHSQREVQAAALVLLAGAISAQQQGELNKQIQLGRTLEMIAAKTPHARASETILAGLKQHALLFDPRLLGLSRTQMDALAQVEGESEWLGYLAGPAGGLNFVDEFLTRGPGSRLVLRTSARMQLDGRRGSWRSSTGPCSTSAYELSRVLERARESTAQAAAPLPARPGRSARSLILRVPPSLERDGFEANRAAIRAVHREVASAGEQLAEDELLAFVCARWPDASAAGSAAGSAAQQPEAGS